MIPFPCDCKGDILQHLVFHISLCGVADVGFISVPFHSDGDHTGRCIQEDGQGEHY